MQTQPHAFRARDLVGGHAVLDLVNTVTARNAVPVDWLDGYRRVLEWARLSGSFDAGVVLDLERLSSAHPVAAEKAVGHLRELRESLLDAFTAQVERRERSHRRLSRLERAWKDAVAHARLVGEPGHVGLELSVARSGLDYIRHDLALQAVALLEVLPIERTRICPGEQCGWLFVDRSRGGKRRWCDMATCGNASKSRRHYARQRAGGKAR